ncbi:MAG TPA: hypothetical protein VFS58_11145 [Steroidobacteraceae bacterium]|nr:hypothetical protein [Steroidobacteraceae bacterium]
MKRRVGLGLTLAMCAAAEAAEPATSPVVREAVPPAATAPEAKPVLAKPLDLRVGDVRGYMMPSEYRAALGAPDAETNTVVVEAKRELLAVDYEKQIPMGPLMPLWWGLTHPTQSWRILVPDINRPDPGPPDVVPPPIFRWGP